MQISKNRANLIMRNGHELTYQNAESKRLCMLDSLDFESKDYKKRILLPLLISLIWWSDAELTYQLQNANYQHSTCKAHSPDS